MRRILAEMGVANYTILSDVSDVYDTPSDGEFRMYSGGTKIEDVKEALNAKATLSMQEYCSKKTLEYREEHGQATASLHYPMGVQGTDEFPMKISELTGNEIPESLRLERGRLIDAMADSQSWLHGKTFAIYGDPDFVHGMARFIMEMGGEPRHRLATNGTKCPPRRWVLPARHFALRRPLPQSLSGQGPLAHALAAGDREGRHADRQLLRQVSRA